MNQSQGEICAYTFTFKYIHFLIFIVEKGEAKQTNKQTKNNNQKTDLVRYVAQVCST